MRNVANWHNLSTFYIVSRPSSFIVLNVKGTLSLTRKNLSCLALPYYCPNGSLGDRLIRSLARSIIGH